MQHNVTRCNLILAAMPVEIGGKRFFTMGEVVDVAGVARQTVWRWKKAGKIPAGRRYRGREVLYTLDEMEGIYAYAHRIEPDDDRSEFQNQLSLFPNLISGHAH